MLATCSPVRLTFVSLWRGRPTQGKLTDTDQRFPDPDRRQRKRLGGKIATSPRDLTFREHTSRGPLTLSPSPAAGSRTSVPLPASAWLPPLPAQGLRMLVRPDSAPGTLLLPRLPEGCPSLAPLAGRTALPRQRPRQRAPTRPESTLSRSTASGTNRPPAARARGPAPRPPGRKKSRLPVPPTRLL